MTGKPMAWHTHTDQDLTGWLVSEKLDGVRACWDGAQMSTRSGRIIHAPAWFVAGLPQIALDGELYAGAGSLPRVQGLARRARAAGADWAGVRYCLFDAPAQPGGFAARLGALRDLAGSLPDHVSVIPHCVCPDHVWLAARFAGVVEAGGEGLVARHPHGPYRPGERSQMVLKIKSNFSLGLYRWNPAQASHEQAGGSANAVIAAGPICAHRERLEPIERRTA